MKIASHNSFSYLPARRWWMKPFVWMARCQRLGIYEQFHMGIRLYDLRVRVKDERATICHGLMEFKGRIYDLLDALDDWSAMYNTPVYVRVVLEKSNPSDEDKDQFRRFCEEIGDYYDLKFFGGNDRSDWDCKHPVYDFGNPMPDIEHKYSSTTSLFSNGPKWLRRIDDLWPWLYARLHNKRNIEKGTTHDWLMIDFVDIR